MCVPTDMQHALHSSVGPLGRGQAADMRLPVAPVTQREFHGHSQGSTHRLLPARGILSHSVAPLCGSSSFLYGFSPFYSVLLAFEPLAQGLL